MGHSVLLSDGYGVIRDPNGILVPPLCMLIQNNIHSDNT